MLPEKLIYVVAALDLLGSFWYIKTIILGHTRPNLVSWFFWMLAPFIATFFQIKAGVGLSVIAVFLSGFGPLMVMVVSLWKKNFQFKITKFDLFCGIFSFFALVLYIITHNLSISISFAILSDGLAAIPTVKKSWQYPETENWSIYAIGIIIHIVALLILHNWIFTLYSFSIYVLCINSIILFSIYRKKITSIFS